MTKPRVSVVVPSHNREKRLPSLLDGLAAQTVEDCEIIVVLDGCRDASAEVVERWSAAASIPVRVASQSHAGAGAARNRGADLATADVIVFLDDDVVPEPDLVERHLAHHEGEGPVVVVGDCPVAVPTDIALRGPGGWRHRLRSRAWWADFNAARAQPGRPVNYRAVCAGNLSLARGLFHAVGGFDETFAGYGSEDWELGHRLLRAGARIIVEPEAVGWHHQDHGRLDGIAHREDEGRADVRMAELHPELIPGLRLADPPPGRSRRVSRTVFSRPLLVRLERLLATVVMLVAEQLSWGGRWRRARDAAYTIAYWQGVAAATGSRRALDDLLGRAPMTSPPTTVVDVAGPLPDHVDLPEELPGRIELTLEGRHLGDVSVPAWASRSAPDIAERIIDAVGPELVLHTYGRDVLGDLREWWMGDAADR